MPCWPGGNGDPLDSEEALQFWLRANRVTGRIYASLGKPVIAEEFGWYGGGKSWFHVDLPYRSEEDQTRLLDRVLETAVGTYAGWLNWAWKDFPNERDITNHSGLFRGDGKTVKHTRGFSANSAGPPPPAAGSIRRGRAGDASSSRGSARSRRRS